MDEKASPVRVTPDNEPFVDLVQVRTDDSFGTGLLVGSGLVLTALHCVCDPERAWKTRNNLGVYLLRDLQIGIVNHLDVKVIWPNLEALVNDSPDVVLLQIYGADLPQALVQYIFGEIPKTPTIGSARGFPASATGILPDGRIEHDQPGRVTYTSITRRALTIDATGHSDIKGLDRWRGLSGGPLIAGRRIVGVMREVPNDWNGEAIEAEPLAPLLRGDESFRSHLRVELPLAGSSDPVQDALADAYLVIGEEAATGSSRAFGQVVEKPLFGRSEDIAVLDKAVTVHERGVILLVGEAGLGKTQLAAHWAQRCASSKHTKVLSHAFSVRESTASSRAAMVANLVRQASILLGPDALGPGDPGDFARLADRLARLLATDRPTNNRLVLVVDAIDEAAEPIEPWTAGLGCGVFILATCRAEPGDEPRTLREWRERSKEAHNLVLHHTLQPLKAEGMAAWLAAVTGQSLKENDPLIANALRVSEGVPLFASLLVTDAVSAIRAGVNDPFPASFASYARKQLIELKDGLLASRFKTWTWGETLDLFAALCVAKAPLPTEALQDLVTRHRLDELDQRAERWLWRRTEKGDVVSFAHPRLAQVFRHVLSQIEEYIISRAQERLVGECYTALSRVRNNPLIGYALEWLPAHLIEFERLEDAAELLGDGGFLQRRLSANPTTAVVHKTASETIQLIPILADSNYAFQWRRFWAESETQVANAVERASSLKLTPEIILAQLAHDRFGYGSLPFHPLANTFKTSQSRIGMRYPCGFWHPYLIKSVFTAHDGVMCGMVALTDRLASWGDDGAIRFWTLSGEAMPGGILNAHEAKAARVDATRNSGINGMLALVDGLVTWGHDRTVRFWGLDGEPRESGALGTYSERLWSIIVLADGLVSLGADDSIRFWTFDGEARSGGDTHAHKGLRGMEVLPNGLVSWGNDGGIRFWSVAGEPRPGGDLKAHDGGVNGVVVLADRLLSWGEDNLIRFWSFSGEPRLSRTPMDGQSYLRRIMALNDGLISWGRDGAIRFWTFEGEPLPEGEVLAHTDWVEGVKILGDGLVSWGRDGAIRIWSQTGDPRPGGDLKAHDRWAEGVLALRNGLVSWDLQGTIRFWALADERHNVDAPKTYDMRINGVLALADNLVSWGEDGTIRYWSLSAEPTLSHETSADCDRPGVRSVKKLGSGLVSYGWRSVRFLTLTGELKGGEPEAHKSDARGVLELPQAVVSWGGDGAIRFWTLEGDSRKGGDPRAHNGGVGKVLALQGALVSSGRDGAIRVWTLEGKPRAGGSLTAHEYGVKGILALANGFVSWGEYNWGKNGAIRWWTSEGGPLIGGSKTTDEAVNDVLVIGDRLVSWGYRSIQFWSLAGERLPGGDLNAHDDQIKGVVVLSDGLASWDHSSIRFWTSFGDPRPGKAASAHHRQIRNVLDFGDGLVTWDYGGTIHFWSPTGELRSGGGQAHHGSVTDMRVIAKTLVSWGSDNVFRRWSFNGVPIGRAWIAPEPVDYVFDANDDLYVFMRGRPYQLLLD